MFKLIMGLLINKNTEEVVENAHSWNECKLNTDDLMVQLLGQDAYIDMKDNVKY